MNVFFEWRYQRYWSGVSISIHFHDFHDLKFKVDQKLNIKLYLFLNLILLNKITTHIQIHNTHHVDFSRPVKLNLLKMKFQIKFLARYCKYVYVHFKISTLNEC